MARSIDPAVWDQWRDRLHRFESCDLTVAAYCRREQVSQASFYQWRKKLRRQTRGNGESSIGTRAFVPVIAAPASVVLTLPNGARVELPSHDHALVGHVIQVAALASGTDS